MVKDPIWIVRPTLTRTCEKCGKHFTVGHPKDPERYCEECRSDKQRKEEAREGGNESI